MLWTERGWWLTSYRETEVFHPPVSGFSQAEADSQRPPLLTGSSPSGALWSLVMPQGFGLGRGIGLMAAAWMQHLSLCQTADSCVGLDGGRSSRAWTVTPTFTRPRSSRM